MIVLLQAAADAHWQRKIDDERSKVNFIKNHQKQL